MIMGANKNKLSVYNGRVYSGKGDHLKFVRLIARNYPVGKAKELSGFSKNYPTKTLMEAANKRQAIYLADEERKSLQSSPGTCLTSSVEFLETIRDDEEIDAKTRIQANKGITDILGHNAPTKVEGEIRGLFLHLNGYTTEDINAAIEANKDNIQDV